MPGTGGSELLKSPDENTMFSPVEAGSERRKASSSARVEEAWAAMKASEMPSKKSSFNFGCSVLHKKKTPPKKPDLPAFLVAMGIIPKKEAEKAGGVGGEQKERSLQEEGGTRALEEGSGARDRVGEEDSRNEEAREEGRVGRVTGEGSAVMASEAEGLVAAGGEEGGVAGGGGMKEEVKERNERERRKADAGREIASSALAAAKGGLSVKGWEEEGKVKVKEVVSFAGEKMEVTRVLDKSSKNFAKRKADMQATSKQGLDALLAQIEKKSKLNILDKSRKDWGEYKEDTGVVEELEEYKKSGGTYTEKVAFLGRTELREYEKERDAKLAAGARKRNGI